MLEGVLATETETDRRIVTQSSHFLLIADASNITQYRLADDYKDTFSGKWGFILF
jgi:hypothetical protein